MGAGVVMSRIGGISRVRQAVPLPPGSNLQLTARRVASNVLAYCTEGGSSAISPGRNRCQGSGVGCQG
jgi:hypothetical protein